MSYTFFYSNTTTNKGQDSCFGIRHSLIPEYSKINQKQPQIITIKTSKYN
jgi:hypothetical protein